MNTFRKNARYLLRFLIIVTPLILGACAHKARMIQAGAAQFEGESLAAIEKIDEMRRKETTAETLPKQKASEFFVNAVKNSSEPINLNTLRILIEPLGNNMPNSEVQWQAFLQNLRLQYTTFAATFASLEKGSLFATPDVIKTVPSLEKLIAQMAAFASSIRDNPPEFIRERAAIAAELEQVREAKPFTDATDLKLLELERRLREIDAAEKQITRETMEQALKAATLGAELKKLIVDYNKLSFDDIAEGISVAFKLTAGINGLDLSGLKAKTDGLVEQINADQSLKELFIKALSEIQTARQEPGKLLQNDT